MPPPEDNISYQGVEAQTSKFFRGLAGDRVIDPAEKSRLATSFFTDVSQIRKVREQNAMAPLRLAREKVELEASRFAMDRARKQADQEDSFNVLGSDVDDEIESILTDDQLLPEDKVQAIRRAEFDAQRRVPPSMPGAGTWLSRKFGTAVKAASPGTSDLTPAQTINLFQLGVPQEIIESGDPMLIGRAAADASKQIESAKFARSQQEDVDKETKAKQATYESALNGLSNIEYATNPSALDELGNPKIDKTKFKGGDIVAAKIKRILAQSPDPELRKLATSDDVPKLREAALKAVSATGSAAPRMVLPARP